MKSSFLVLGLRMSANNLEAENRGVFPSSFLCSELFVPSSRTTDGLVELAVTEMPSPCQHLDACLNQHLLWAGTRWHCTSAPASQGSCPWHLRPETGVSNARHWEMNLLGGGSWGRGESFLFSQGAVPTLTNSYLSTHIFLGSLGMNILIPPPFFLYF